MRRHLLSAADVQAMHRLFSGFYQNADAATFLRDLSKKDGAVLVQGVVVASVLDQFAILELPDVDRRDRDSGHPHSPVEYS